MFLLEVLFYLRTLIIYDQIHDVLYHLAILLTVHMILLPYPLGLFPSPYYHGT